MTTPPIPRYDELFDAHGVAFDVDMSDLDYRPGLKQRTKVTSRRLRWTRCAVFGRDEWRCQSCGLEFPHDDPMIASGSELPEIVVDRRYVRVDQGCLWFDDPEYQWRDVTTHLTLDHVIPYLHGGAFKVANLQALCNRCNGRKGASL